MPRPAACARPGRAASCRTRHRAGSRRTAQPWSARPAADGRRRQRRQNHPPAGCRWWAAGCPGGPGAGEWTRQEYRSCWGRHRFRLAAPAGLHAARSARRRFSDKRTHTWHASPLQTVVLAGFYVEEIAGVRQLLDQMGAAEVRDRERVRLFCRHAPLVEQQGVPAGQTACHRRLCGSLAVALRPQPRWHAAVLRGPAQVKLVPATPARLHLPLAEVLASPEPQASCKSAAVCCAAAACCCMGGRCGAQRLRAALEAAWPHPARQPLQCCRSRSPALPRCCPRPQWDQPVPQDWLAGGGWGQQPMVLMAGLE